ncbi:hypothetical protein Tco_1546284 [Tanacetum coccineum]
MGLFADSTGCMTPFVRWIEEYPLPDGLKMPSYVRSYDGKGDPDNYFHLFKGAIRMQKWTMPVACHMFTYTLKDPTRYVGTGKKHVVFKGIGKALELSSLDTQVILCRFLGYTKNNGFLVSFMGKTRSLMEFLSIDLPTTYKGLMKKTYTWIEVKEAAKKRASSNHK